MDGRPAPVRRFLPELIRLIWDRTIAPGKVFDLTLPLGDAAKGYRAMDERRGDPVSRRTRGRRTISVPGRRYARAVRGRLCVSEGYITHK
ncbi:hypothetical protein B7C42_05336 [Nocardia cerradoensis]|uniref:Uncharacterized protein n=1 Tax=Nocardia cerradoensis TaxID=85688 RepID=A0A231H135_9NOCA|nr:hypothetical protein B7C42_05336 [Nocardia cerradoensis]